MSGQTVKDEDGMLYVGVLGNPPGTDLGKKGG